MGAELQNILVLIIGVVVVAGLLVAITKLKDRNLIEEDLLLTVMDLIAIVNENYLPDNQYKVLAEGVLDTITFVQTVMSEKSEVEQKEKAEEMLQGLIKILDIDGITDAQLKRIINLSFALLRN